MGVRNGLSVQRRAISDRRLSQDSVSSAVSAGRAGEHRDGSRHLLRKGLASQETTRPSASKLNSVERNVVAPRGVVTSGLFSAPLVAGLLRSQDCKRHSIWQWTGKGSPALTQGTPLHSEILGSAPRPTLSSRGLT